MQVKVAAQIIQFQQVGQPAFQGLLELAAGFTQLGGNSGQAKGLVDFLLGASGDALFAAIEAVIGELQPAI